MFETIIEKAKPMKMDTPVEGNPFSTLELNGEALSSYLSAIHPDEELNRWMKNFYPIILKDIYENNNLQAKELLYRADNLKALEIALENRTADPVSKNHINEFIYEFFTKKEQEINTKPIYLHLSKLVNADVVSRLSVYVPSDLAALLAMAKNSTLDINKATKRVNSVLIQQDTSFLTEQKIVDIYVTLYDRITPLFLGVMSDYRNPKQMSDSMSENWSLLDLALLDILENMPSEEIAKVLRSYVETERMGYLKQPKFSLDSINTVDYPRTVNVYHSIVFSQTPIAL